MYKKTLILSLVIFASLSGCANNYPLPIKEPVAVDKDNVRTKPDYAMGGLLPATMVSEAKDNLRIYRDKYIQNADELRMKMYKLSDVGFGGGVIGVIGGLTKSVTTAISGAVLATSSPMITERYQYTIQAANYDKAAEAMNCMYNLLYPVDDNDNIGLEQLVNAQIDEVRYKLRKSQAEVKLADVDTSKLEKSISDTSKIHAEKEIYSVNLENNSSGFTQMGLDELDIDELKSKLTTCVAKF